MKSKVLERCLSVRRKRIFWKLTESTSLSKDCNKANKIFPRYNTIILCVYVAGVFYQNPRTICGAIKQGVQFSCTFGKNWWGILDSNQGPRHSGLCRLHGSPDYLFTH